MKLAVFDSFSEQLEKIWKALEPVSQHHIFQCYGWLAFWQETVGTHVLGIKPWIGVISEDEGEPRMIFPFGTRRLLGAQILEFLGGAQSDYLGPLIHNDWISNSSSIEVAWSTVKQLLPRHDVCHYVKLPARWCNFDNPMLSIWKPIFQGYSYSARLPPSFEDFQSRLRPKLNQDTKRQRRRLSSLGKLCFRVVGMHETERHRAIETMIEQKRQRYHATGVPDILSYEPVRKFYHDLSGRLGNIHFSVLQLDDQILATHWGAIYRERYYFLMPTFASGKWGSYSSGRLLLENLVEWCIQNGLKVFDFTIGGEEYKKDWCDIEMPLSEHLHVRTPLGLPYLAYIRLRRRARGSERIWGIVKFIYSKFQSKKYVSVNENLS